MRFKQIHIIILLSIFFVKNVKAQQLKLIYVNADKVAAIKQSIKSNETLTKKVVELKRQADKLFNYEFGSVMDKKFTPPCGNMHEYMSLAKYFWYDSSKPDGKPYIRKDGQKNPEVDKITDDKYFDKLIASVRLLSWAYYFTDENKYAEKATNLIRFWFLDTATMMLPNLNHAQMTTGSDTGRGSGIIDTHNLPLMLDDIALLRLSPFWKKEDEVGIKQWFSSYLNWMLTSKNGKHEGKTKNNHKTFYDNQIAAIALFCGQNEIANNVASNAKKIIEHQIEPDGKQPEELVRTLGISYSSFNIEALFSLAKVAEKIGVNLWHFETEDGRSIKKALDYILPYAMNEKKWEYQQIKPFVPKDFYGLLLQAAVIYNDENYKKQAEKIKDANKNILVKIFYE
ncbi:MAG: alginate lyase family protein [Chitinophagaceae bacterium]